MVKRKCRTPAQIAAIPGIGASRIQRYGEKFAALLRCEEEGNGPAPENDAKDAE
jgi:hypothetical protein